MVVSNYAIATLTLCVDTPSSYFLYCAIPEKIIGVVTVTSIVCKVIVGCWVNVPEGTGKTWCSAWLDVCNLYSTL